MERHRQLPACLLRHRIASSRHQHPDLYRDGADQRADRHRGRCFAEPTGHEGADNLSHPLLPTGGDAAGSRGADVEAALQRRLWRHQLACLALPGSTDPIGSPIPISRSSPSAASRGVEPSRLQHGHPARQACRTIPRDYYEAAEIDGAGGFRQFFWITVPLLTPSIFFVCVIAVINAFQALRSRLPNDQPNQSSAHTGQEP